MNRYSGVGLICNGKILLCKRSEGTKENPLPFGGFWSIFTGSIEKNEGPISCAARETKEESGINLKIQDIKYVKTLYEEDSLLHVYMSEIKSEVIPDLNEEHTDFVWTDIKLLDSFPHKLDDKIVECVKKYQRNKY
jgi:8-oxo-dGTP pyrophosphatase MutT (NUDIX family)